MKENYLFPVFGHSGYCWIKGKVVATELKALGYKKLCYELFANKKPEEIESLIKRFVKIFEEIKEEHEKGKEIKGPYWYCYNENSEFDNGKYSTFKKVSVIIECTLCWLRMLK